MLRRMKLAILGVVVLGTSVASAASPATEALTRLDGLQASGKVIRDEYGVPHIFAQNEHDLIFLQGWAHARDRLFQMDVGRRQAEGTLAELLGPGALPSDVQLRTFGVRRSAERSWPILSVQTQMALTAYAKGVNAYLSRNPLPPEYAALELTRVRPWAPVDSLAIFKLTLFDVAFDLSDLDRTTVLSRYRAAGVARGFDGDALFFQDTNPVAPFTTAATIPDAMGIAPRTNFTAQVQGVATAGRSARAEVPVAAAAFDAQVMQLAEEYSQRLKELPWVSGAMRQEGEESGSNQFVISGRLSTTGEPILANDPHLLLGNPAVFYDNHLRAPGIDAIGSTLPGTAFIVIGHNDHYAWGVTTNPVDVTDVYQERLIQDGGSPSGLSTLHDGVAEPVVALPQVFRSNSVGDGVADSVAVVPAGGTIPAAVLIVPRRNNGPIVTMNLAAGVALSVQFAGFSGTREPQAARALVRGRNLEDFTAALQGFDVGSQNWMFADVRGNTAYLTSGEVPLREDLDAGEVVGVPPFLIRNGQGGNEWIAAPSAGDRSIPFAVVPSAEMPRLVNPSRGYIVNANNDPFGDTLDNDLLNARRPNGGILYLSSGYDPGIRAGRIRELFELRLAEQRRLSARDLQQFQADVVMGDAQLFTPHIVHALENAQRADAPALLSALGVDPRVQEAVARLAAWDHSTPTGIPEGFDAADENGQLSEPDATEIEHSVAATIYSVWRSQFIGQSVIATLGRRALPVFAPRAEVMTTLKSLLEDFHVHRGVGASGIDFFEVPGVALAQDRRDVVILRSLVAALNSLAGPNFAAAFDRSTSQQDYRWGKLHRIVFAHPLGAPFGIPPAGGTIPAPLPGLPGIPTDGGPFTVDLAGHGLAANASNAFMFDGGPSRRFVARIQSIGRGIEAVSSLPGGESGVLGSPFFANLLTGWLTNETYPLRQDVFDLPGNIAEIEVFVPAR